MARVKMREFSGGLNLSGDPDIQPKNTLRKAANIAPPIAGRIRVASPPKAILTAIGVPVDAFIRYQNRYVIASLSGPTFKLETGDYPTDTWTTITPAKKPPAYTTPIAFAGKTTFVLAPPNDGRHEALFFVDRQSGGQNLWKLIDPTDASKVSLWGILPPSAGNTTGVVTSLQAQGSKYVNTVADQTDPLESAEGWTLAAADENGLDPSTSLTWVAPPAVDGQSAKIHLAKDDAAQITHDYGANVDLTTFTVVGDSSDQDYIQFFVRIRRPKHLENFEVTFSTGDTNYNNTFTSQLTFQLVKGKKSAKLTALGDLVKNKDIQQFLKDEQTKNYDIATSTTLSTGTQQFPVAKNHWTRVTLPKAVFSIGNNADWSQVKSVRFTATANKQGATAVFIDSLKLVGGVGIVGDYQYTLTFRNSSTGTRSNPNIDQNGVIAVIHASNAERQGIKLQLPAMSFDPQADQVEVWRTVGNGATFFLAGRLQLTTPGTVTGGVGDTIIDKTADYIGLHSTSTTYSEVITSGTYNGNAILDPATELLIDNDSPNDPAFAFEDAVGIHVGRMWFTRNTQTVNAFGSSQDALGQVYYSPAARYEAVQDFIQVTPGRSDPVQKLIVWNDRLFAFTSAGVFEIVGVDEPFVAQKVEGAPGVQYPDSIVSSQAGIFYVAWDGVYMFNGQWAQNITDATLQPIFKWKEAVEQFPASTTWLEAVVSKNALFMIGSSTNDGVIPTAGSTNGGLVLVLDLATQAWRYRDSAPRCLYYDHVSGQILGAIGTGAIYDIEPTPFNTGAPLAQTFVLKTATVRVGSGQKGVLRKVFLDIDSQSVVGILPTIQTDEVVSNLSTISTATGRRTVEWTVNTAGERFLFEVSFVAAAAVEIFGVEFDIYVPGVTIQDSGLGGDS